MIKKIIIVFVLISVTLGAKELIVTGENKMVKTKKLQETNSVYLGSFLAQGKLPASKIYRIDAPVEGAIKLLNVDIFQKVSKNQLLAVIKSPKMLELEATYINLLIEEEYNKNELARLQPLYEAAVVSKKQYLKAKNTLAKYKTQSEFYYHLLQEWGMSSEQVDKIKATKKPIPEIKIYAPIDGKVADLNIFPKMYLQRGEHMMTILNNKGVHFEVALPLNIANRLQKGFKLFIDSTPVVVEAIAAEIDSRTQTLAIHLLPENSMELSPNEKRNIKLYWPKRAFEVSASAIIDYNDKEAVFVKQSNGYKLVEVNVLSRNSDKVYLLSKELSKQSDVVINGAISLKGALEGQSDD